MEQQSIEGTVPVTQETVSVSKTWLMYVKDYLSIFRKKKYKMEITINCDNTLCTNISEI